MPKKFGGLNIKSCRNLNVASVGKLVWKLAMRKELLRVKWVDVLYVKGGQDF